MPQKEYLRYLGPDITVRDFFDTQLENFLNSLVKVETKGTENQIPKVGPFVCGISPHTGFVEVPVVHKIIKEIRGNAPICVTKDENKAFKFILGERQVIYIDRNQLSNQSGRLMINVLQHPMGCLETASEGTRYGNPEDPNDRITFGKVKKEYLNLAIKQNIPFLIATVIGTDKVLPEVEKDLKSNKSKVLEDIKNLRTNPPLVQVRFNLYTENISKMGKKLKKEEVTYHQNKIEEKIINEILKIDPNYPILTRGKNEDGES